jgi:hypothetical protein
MQSKAQLKEALQSTSFLFSTLILHPSKAVGPCDTCFRFAFHVKDELVTARACNGY